MPEYELELTPDIRRYNLAANYAQARAKHLTPAMVQSVAAVEGAVRARIPVGGSGEAVRSIGSKIVQLPSRMVGRVSSSFRRPKVYIYVLNYGRLPGKKAPPTTALVPWVQAKGLAQDARAARHLAYVIARKIKEKGNRHPPYTREAYRSVHSQVEAFHARAVEAIVQELEHAD